MLLSILFIYSFTGSTDTLATDPRFLECCVHSDGLGKLFDQSHFYALLNNPDSLALFRERVATDPKFCYCYVRNDKHIKNMFEQFHHYAMLGNTEDLDLFFEHVVAKDPNFWHCYIKVEKGPTVEENNDYNALLTMLAYVPLPANMVKRAYLYQGFPEVAKLISSFMIRYWAPVRLGTPPPTDYLLYIGGPIVTILAL
jgi:hypothetical protein